MDDGPTFRAHRARSADEPPAAAHAAPRPAVPHADTSPEPSTAGSAPWWRRPELVLIVALVAAIHGARMTTLSIRGEESRWATVAVEMLASSDWIVPRQQGQVFPDRPPLGSWAMALVGAVRGQVDAVAIRLPSVLAVVLTSLAIYAYASAFLSRGAALVAALAYPTMGQVLELGGLGESEALYTLLVSGSLLAWHAAYRAHCSPTLAWCCGYTVAAAATLTKGIQATAYFVVPTVVFLLLRRDGRYLFSRGHACGIALFSVLVGAWLVPFCRAAGSGVLDDLLFDLFTRRIGRDGLLEQIATYPLETLACMLPWSVLLLELPQPRFYRRLGEAARSQLLFLLVALATTYPSVWWANGARSRYYMPLYPVVACLIGWGFEQLVALRRESPARRELGLYWIGLATAMTVILTALAAASTVDDPRLAPFAQSGWLLGVYLLLGGGLTALVLWAWRDTSPSVAVAAAVGLAVFLGGTYSTVAVTAIARTSRDIESDVAGARRHLPEDVALVSFGPIFHRFAYYYAAPIDEIPWPTSADEVPPHVTYFCFTHHVGDTAQWRQNGRTEDEFTGGTLPFVWELVAEVPYTRSLEADPRDMVIIGRIVRGEAPDHRTAERPAP